jgi:dihydrofolate synthase/folylpolyglutamate synthase
VNAPAANPVSPLAEVIARLSALHPASIDLSLKRIQRLLERLGHPERKLPPVIHVAGTNGKGSTVAYLRAMLEAAGLRVHAYTSPYLVRPNECYRLGRVGGGTLVSDEELTAALQRCEAANAGAPITVFESKTAAAFCLFADNPADVVLLEVGLGGRLDATNMIERPLASVITPVSMDHMEFLGTTLTSIAGEKAAIIKPSVPVVSSEQADEVMAVIEREAKRLRAPLFAAGQQWHVGIERGRLVYQDERGLMDLAAPKLFGRHQFDNAGLGSRRACVAPARHYRRHDGEQGCRRLPRQFRRSDPPHHRGSDSGRRKGDAAGAAGRRHAPARHARRDLGWRRGGARLAGASCL